MLGPNGEKLKIVIQAPKNQGADTCNQRRYAQKITIESNRHFSNYSTMYRPDIGCPTMTHEILHLLGLCDEYNAGDLYGCRVVMRYSIMSDSHTRWDNVFAGKTNSLLNPGQFNAILYGSCDKKKQDF